jgi:ABC-type bacteriocin/lantibiotic exporter with double-glycine peptidase domain
MSGDARYRADTIGQLYGVIWRITGRQQLLLIALSVIVAALAAAPLRFQQLVINGLVEDGDIYRVAWLCADLLGVTLLSAALKFALSFRMSILGERVQALRDASDRISESALARVEDEVVADFQRAFGTRRRLFLLKLSSKFALSAISVAGAVGVLFLGGWLVLNGRTDVGTVVASLTGLTRIERPWRELVSFFRNASTVRVKYAMLVRSIMPRLVDPR